MRGTVTLDSDGVFFLHLEILQEVGWQTGERLIVESVDGAIRLVSADSSTSDAQDAVPSRLEEG
jgi:hypothetical protein